MRDAESIAPKKANAAATNNGVMVVSPPCQWKKNATNAAPIVWPVSRAVASMPLAEPLRCCGAEAIIMLLLGDWKSPNPMPHSTSRHIISKSVGLDGSTLSAGGYTVLTLGMYGKIGFDFTLMDALRFNVGAALGGPFLVGMFGGGESLVGFATGFYVAPSVGIAFAY